MDHANVTQLVTRIERLEKQNRQIKVIYLAGLVVFIGTILLGATTPRARELTAERFVVKDAQGNTRAVLGVGNTGTGLSILDDKSTNRLWVGVTSKGNPQMELGDRTGNTRMALYVHAPETMSNGAVAGLPFPVWARPSAADKANLGPQDEASFDLFDDKGIERGLFRIGGSRVYLGLSHGSASFLAEAHDLGVTTTLEDGGNFITRLGNAQTILPSTGETHTSSAASAIMFDKKGDVIWSAP
jgi:hypothetical protein